MAALLSLPFTQQQSARTSLNPSTPSTSSSVQGQSYHHQHRPAPLLSLTPSSFLQCSQSSTFDPASSARRQSFKVCANSTLSHHTIISPPSHCRAWPLSAPLSLSSEQFCCLDLDWHWHWLTSFTHFTILTSSHSTHSLTSTDHFIGSLAISWPESSSLHITKHRFSNFKRYVLFCFPFPYHHSHSSIELVTTTTLSLFGQLDITFTSNIFTSTNFPPAQRLPSSNTLLQALTVL